MKFAWTRKPGSSVVIDHRAETVASNTASLLPSSERSLRVHGNRRVIIRAVHIFRVQYGLAARQIFQVIRHIAVANHISLLAQRQKSKAKRQRQIPLETLSGEIWASSATRFA